MATLVVSILLTLIILYLSLLTISKGYAFKHTVDPIDPVEEQDHQEKKGY
ncbi:YtzI protein [Virgibacillus sp. W0430]